MLHVALVGYGLSGQTIQAPFFAQHPLFRLKRIVTNNQNPALKYPGVLKTQSLEDVLQDPEIDLVSITSPDETHAAYARQCLLAGKHVLVEKPFAANLEEAVALQALAKECGKHLFVFQNRRFDSDFRTLRQVLEQGLIGTPLRFEAHYNRFKPELSPKPWKELITPASGILYGLGPHILDQAICLFGKPNSFWGQTNREREHTLIDDAFDLHLDYGRLKVHLSSSLMVREETPRYVVHGTLGSFVKYGIDPQEDHLKTGLLPGMPGFGIESPKLKGILHTTIGELNIRGRVESLPGDWGILFQNIADVLLKDEKPLIPIDDVLEQMRILESINR